MQNSPGIIAFAILVVLAACAPNQAQVATSVPTVASTGEATLADPHRVTWIRENAIPFKTTQAGSGFEDLHPLKKIVGDVFSLLFLWNRRISHWNLLSNPLRGSRPVGVL